MKHLWKVLIVCMLVLTTVFAVSACGDDETDSSSSSTSTGSSSGSGSDSSGDTPGLPTVDVAGVVFRDLTVTYDGTLHKLSGILGKPARTEVRYEYYDAEGNLLEGEGATEPGVYTVKAILSQQGLQDGIVEATLTIEEAWTVSYEGLEGAEIPRGNPLYYSPVSGAFPLADAEREGYKFKGWYTDAAFTNRVTELADDSTGPVTFYAKWLAYLPVPAPYDFAKVTTAPTVLPNIPGYDDQSADSVLFADMSKIGPDFVDDPGNPGATIYGAEATKNTVTTVTTQDGTVVSYWHNPTLYNKETGTADARASQQLSFTQFTNFAEYDAATDKTLVDVTEYDVLEFWMYNANAFPDTRFIIHIVGPADNVTLRTSITLDWTGWKKFSISLDAMYRTGWIYGETKMMSIRFCNTFGDANLQELEDDDVYLYLSNLYLRKVDSTQDTVTPQYPGKDMQIALENMAQLLEGKVDDAAIDTLVAGIDTSSDKYWDVSAWSKSDVQTVYANLASLAAAWNAPASKYYHDEDLLATIGDALNYMYENSKFGQNIVDGGYTIAADPEYADAARNLVTILLTIGDNVSVAQAKILLAPVDYLYPGIVTADLLNSGFIVAGRHLLVQDPASYLTVLSDMTSLITTRGTSVLTGEDAEALTDLILFYAANKGTVYASTAESIADLFDFYFDYYDGMSYKGQVHFGDDTSADELARMTAAMMFVYDQADELDQASFSGALLYYLAQNSAFESAMTAIFKYAVQTELLADIKAAGTARVTEAFSQTYNTLGVVIYKTDSFFIQVTKDGDIQWIGLDDNENGTITATGDLSILGGVATDGAIAFQMSTSGSFSKKNAVIAIGDEVYVLSFNGAGASSNVIDTANGVGVQVGNVQAYVIIGEYAGTEGIEVSAPCAFIIKANEDASYDIVVKNHQGMTGECTIILALPDTPTELIVGDATNTVAEYDGELQAVALTLTFDGNADTVYTLTIK